MSKRQYGCFERKRGEKKWTRVHPNLAGPKSWLVIAAQDWLLAPFFQGLAVERKLDVVKPTDTVEHAKSTICRVPKEVK